MKTNIKAICFDLDGVYFTPKGKKSFHQALSEELTDRRGQDYEDFEQFLRELKHFGIEL